MDYKSKGWRDNTKRDRTPLWGQVQKWVTNSYTPEQWQKAFKDHLSWKEKFELLSKVNPQPREIQGKIDNNIRVIFTMTGLKDNKIIEVDAQSSRAQELQAAVLDDEEDAT